MTNGVESLIGHLGIHFGEVSFQVLCPSFYSVTRIFPTDLWGNLQVLLMRDPESTNHKRKNTAKFEFIKISFSSSKDIMRV